MGDESGTNSTVIGILDKSLRVVAEENC